MSTATPSAEEIRKILGPYSIASVRNWLKRCELPRTANSRDDLVQRVHSLIEKKSLTLEGLIAAMIGIEEASSKRTFLFQIPCSEGDIAKTDKQLSDLKVPLSSQRVPARNPTAKPTMAYAINGEGELRIKWTELQKRVQAIRKTRSWTELNVPKIIVLVWNKTTGVVQLRCDHPEDEHQHVINGESTSEAYYSHYVQKSENLLGHSLQPMELRASLAKILKAEPRIVRTAHAVDESDDGGYTKRSHKHKHKDVRDLADWQNMMKSRTVRTFEEAPLKWIPEMTGGKLQREVGSYIDAANSLVRFDADCYEEEIEYVLSHLV